MCEFMLLTRHSAAQDLHPHARGAVPALGKDADVARHHRLHELRHHGGVFIRVPEEQLRENEIDGALSPNYKYIYVQ